MNLWQNYVCPTTLAEALLALREAPGGATPVAGGTDLLLDLEQGRHSPTSTLVDLTAVQELTALEARGQELFIGGAVPLAQVAAHPLVAMHAQALVEACDLIGGPQVRNVATLGGNVAHALPAADGTIALLALDAEVEIANLDGSRRVPIAEIFEGPGRSTLRAACDLIVGFWLHQIGPLEGSAFRRIMRPQGVALPILNCGVWMRRTHDIVADVRIVVGPAGPTPRRARDAEVALRGQVFSAATCQLAAQAILEHTPFRTSARRASADYRRALAESLVQDALICAWNRTAQ